MPEQVQCCIPFCLHLVLRHGNYTELCNTTPLKATMSVPFHYGLQVGGVPVEEEGVDHDVEQQACQHIVGVEGQQGGAGDGCQGGWGVLPGLHLLKARVILGHMGPDVLQPQPVGARPCHREVPPVEDMLDWISGRRMCEHIV